MGGPDKRFGSEPKVRNPQLQGLRDLIAMEAMHGMLAAGMQGQNSIARSAYLYADAMLEARE